jgi:hypothetical protein
MAEQLQLNQVVILETFHGEILVLQIMMVNAMDVVNVITHGQQTTH